MENFFTKELCDRCDKSLKDEKIMSMINEQCICIDCKAKEEKLPEYKEILNRERSQIKFIINETTRK